jgi:hypothetical protein
LTWIKAVPCKALNSKSIVWSLEVICTMIRDDIITAMAHGNYRHAAELKLALRHFLQHSCCKTGSRSANLS